MRDTVGTANLVLTLQDLHSEWKLRRPWHPYNKDAPLGEENGYPLQYSCLGNPTDRGAWWATALGVAKTQT